MCGVLWIFCFPVSARAQSLPDSSLRETLTRSVQHWQAGRAREAYLALDTLAAAALTPDNAATKVKAAIWTASYLQAQFRLKPAAIYLDSALIWAERYAPGEPLARAYDAYAAWHLAAGNPKTAMVAKEASWKIRDSVHTAVLQHRVDSLTQVNAALVQEQQETIRAVTSETTQAGSTASALQKWLYILGTACVILLVIVFLLNGNLQRLKRTPPAPLPAPPRTRTEETSPAAEEMIQAPTPAPPPATPPRPAPSPNNEIILRLQNVELVLIRAESLGLHQKGDQRSIRNFLNEYMAQLPFIMKTLDDAITKNEAAPILNSLEHLKPYLHTFGMAGTMKLITEIEAEAGTEKISKLLSRVFQIRNHCRRAADEAKAILENL